MTEKDKQEGPVFNPEGIRRLLREGGGEDLNDDDTVDIDDLFGVLANWGPCP